MKLLERPEARTHPDQTVALYQQTGQSEPEPARDEAAQILALGERAISETISADPPATLRALRQKNCE